MHASPTFQPPAAATQAGTPSQRRVVDAPTRLFHWLFALSFLGAYITADGERWRALHVTLGYLMVGLLAFRVLYGLIGPRHARLGLLMRKLTGAPAWLKSAAQGLRGGTWSDSLPRIDWRRGLHLLMAAAVVGLLGLVIPLTLSGYGTYQEWGDFLGGDWLAEVHEFFGNAFMAVVLGHIGLIAMISLLRRRNQALPMLTGRTEGAGPDLIKRNHGWLAVLLLAGVLAFMGWQWQQAPQGLIPAQGQAQSGSHRHHHGDD